MNVQLNIINNVNLENVITDKEEILETLAYSSHPEIHIDGFCNNESFDIYHMIYYIKELSCLNDSSEQLVDEDSLEIDEDGLIKFTYIVSDALFYHYQENPNGTLVLDQNGDTIMIDEQEIDKIEFYFEGYLTNEEDEKSVFYVSKLTTNFTRFTNNLTNPVNLDDR
jgi:hypothetical protein